MNEQWLEKLASAGIDIAHGVDDKLGLQATGATPMLAELSPLAIVDITGTDATTFFQAQVCNDLAALSVDQAQINGYCTPKGRLLALFTVYPHLDGYRLLVPEDVAPAFVKRLQMYVMRAQVEVRIRTDLICTGLVTKEADGSVPSQFAQTITALPQAVLGVSRGDQSEVLRWHDLPSDQENAQPRYIIVAEQDSLLPLWQDSQYAHAPFAYWRWGDINAGIPSVVATSAEQFIPQMLNMQLINALSFKKGCYPGQEIVARMQYLGKLKKHMKHLRADGVMVAPAPGDVLVTDTNNNAGQVVDAIVDDHGVNLLAVVNIQTAVDELKLADVALHDAVLPYSLAPEPDKDS